jgi:4-hydroxybutyrate CoA-transferase
MTTTAIKPGEWQALYAARLLSAEDAAASIRSGEHIYIPVGQQPKALVDALLLRDDLRDVTITCLPLLDYGWLVPEQRGRLRINVLYASAATRPAIADGSADYTPFMMYGAHKAIDGGRAEARPLDVVVISVTPPNEHGYVCLGTAVWDALTAARRARRVLAIVNRNLPTTFGDSWLHVSEIACFVEHHAELPPRVETPVDPWDAAIAGYAGSLVQHGDTIQIGTGSTSGNIVTLGGLDGREDLGYFGELTVPGTIDLVRQGVINGKRMVTHPGRFVATTAGNSPDDRAFISGNPAFEFRAIDYVHDPRAISANDHYVALNNAITVDLGGQIAASAIGPYVYSGTGGHLSFALGAFMAAHGRYVCVLPATARGGTVSRIVPRFEAGQIVTVPREYADTIVTEYGIAHLLNKSVRERTDALIAIAHPDFRAELRREAQRLLGG